MSRRLIEINDTPYGPRRIDHGLLNDVSIADLIVRLLNEDIERNSYSKMNFLHEDVMW